MRRGFPWFWGTIAAWAIAGVLMHYSERYMHAQAHELVPAMTTAQQLDRTHKGDALQQAPLDIPGWEPMWLHPQEKGGVLDVNVVRTLTFRGAGRSTGGS